MTEQRIHVYDQQIEMIDLDSIKPHPKNVRQGNVGAIYESAALNGFWGAMIVQRSSGHVLAGSHRYQALKADGQRQGPVIYLDVDDDQAERIMLNDNRSVDDSTYDQVGLARLLAEIYERSGTLMGTGYEADDLDNILTDLEQRARTAQEAPATPDPTPEPTPAVSGPPRSSWSLEVTLDSPEEAEEWFAHLESHGLNVRRITSH